MKIAICNEKTERVVQDWIDAVAALPERHSVEAWMNSVNEMLINLEPGQDAQIEMRALWTASGRPETLRFEEGDFDWLDLPEEEEQA